MALTRIQFSLRSLFLLTTFAALLCIAVPAVSKWLRATFWDDAGGPGSIASYQGNISCGFSAHGRLLWSKHRKGVKRRLALTRQSAFRQPLFLIDKEEVNPNTASIQEVVTQKSYNAFEQVPLPFPQQR